MISNLILKFDLHFLGCQSKLIRFEKHLVWFLFIIAGPSVFDGGQIILNYQREDKDWWEKNETSYGMKNPQFLVNQAGHFDQVS